MTMNPLVQAMKNMGRIDNSHMNSPSNTKKTEVVHMINSMSPEQKARLKNYLPMIQSLARKFGVSDNDFERTINESNL